MVKEDLLEKGALYFDHIQQGFEKYDFQTLYMDGDKAFDYLEELWIKNGKEHSFVDFYYVTLEQSSKDMILDALEEEERRYIEKLCGDGESIYFPMDETLLRIITKLNDREILFSTCYFTKEPRTLWGNFKQEYVEFVPKK
ncbi:MAG: hypothetical protein MRZ69_09645 [Lachnospiraceae bacterium]|nr:hypothetical protein [Lachnospiraceae bacterium]